MIANECHSIGIKPEIKLKVLLAEMMVLLVTDSRKSVWRKMYAPSCLSSIKMYEKLMLSARWQKISSIKWIEMTPYFLLWHQKRDVVEFWLFSPLWSLKKKVNFLLPEKPTISYHQSKSAALFIFFNFWCLFCTSNALALYHTCHFVCCTDDIFCHFCTSMISEMLSFWKRMDRQNRGKYLFLHTVLNMIIICSNSCIVISFIVLVNIYLVDMQLLLKHSWMAQLFWLRFTLNSFNHIPMRTFHLCPWRFLDSSSFAIAFFAEFNLDGQISCHGVEPKSHYHTMHLLTFHQVTI